jgi:hypothetical protein
MKEKISQDNGTAIPPTKEQKNSPSFAGIKYSPVVRDRQIDSRGGEEAKTGYEPLLR